MSDLLARYEALSQRERLLVLVTLVAAIYVVFSFLVFGNLDATQKEREQKLSQLQQEESTMQAELQVYNNLLNSDPDKAKKQQIKVFRQQMRSLDESLTRLSVGLIPAEELPKLLQSVLEESKGLKLHSIKTLPVSELSLQGEVIESIPEDGDSESEEPETQKRETAGVFKHAVVMELTGGYFDIHEYVEALENLPWRLYWDSLDYSVTRYPNARVMLQVYTLSTEVGAFGEK